MFMLYQLTHVHFHHLVSLVMEKAMVKKSFDGTESRVYGVLENICDRQNFLTYDYIPPKMVAQCKKLIGE